MHIQILACISCGGQQTTRPALKHSIACPVNPQLLISIIYIKKLTDWCYMGVCSAVVMLARWNTFWSDAEWNFCIKSDAYAFTTQPPSLTSTPHHYQITMIKCSHVKCKQGLLLNGSGDNLQNGSKMSHHNQLQFILHCCHLICIEQKAEKRKACFAINKHRNMLFKCPIDKHNLITIAQGVSRSWTPAEGSQKWSSKGPWREFRPEWEGCSYSSRHFTSWAHLAEAFERFMF